VGSCARLYLLYVVTDKRIQATQTYEPPVLRVVGTVHELTLNCKDFSGSDGMFLLNPSNTLGSC
jgi:hypothetical protein